jgi:hypothetical protein
LVVRIALVTTAIVQLHGLAARTVASFSLAAY